VSSLYLLDTNILSELGKKTPDVQVINFVSQLDIAYLSIISVHEIEYGLQLLPQGQRRDQLTQSMASLLQNYADFVITVTQQIASEAAKLRAFAQQKGRVLHLADALIAATAIAHGGLTLATRNVKDFAGLSMDTVNPFS
jgi:predicted nucleic acid-binding protein